MMNGTAKKRKRPFNWDDVYHSSSEDEKKIIKKRLLEANFNINATFQSSSDDEDQDKKALEEQGCVLCGHLKYGGCDVSDSIEHSEHTYGDVLQKLFNRTPEFEARKEEEGGVTFEAGKLCTICKVRLQTLYRLQKELREEKTEIMNIFKDSKNVRKERKIEKNVNQILCEMKSAKKLQDKKKKKMFKNNSDSLLDYTAASQEKEQQRSAKTPQKTPEQNKSNIKRFTIQSLKRRKGDRYLIRWDGYSDEENTWELRASIPEYILKYYEDDPERLGLPAPSVPDKYNPTVVETIRDSDEEEERSKTENFDINSIIDGLYKDQDDKLKMKLKKQSNTNFYVQDDSDKPLKKRLTSGSNSQKFLTKAALKHSDDDSLKAHEEPQEMKSLLLEEEEVDNFNISFNNSSKNDSPNRSFNNSSKNDSPNKSLNNSSKNDSHNKSDLIDESPQAAKEKDSKKTRVLGKIFVSTPDRRRSEDIQERKSEEMIKAVLEEEDIYTIEALVAKKGSKYLVKWENFPSDQNTWEPRSAIPPFIVKFYEQDLSRLGRPVPAPPSPESEYIPAVDSRAEDSDAGYDRDDDWKPKDKKRRRKSGSTSSKKAGSKAANDSINQREKEMKTPNNKRK